MRSRALLGTLVLTCVLVIATVLVVSNSDGGANPVVRAQPAPANAPQSDGVTYPAQMLAQFQKQADMSPGDTVEFKDDNGPAMYMTKDDFVRMNVSDYARGSGLPYNPSDLLAPLRDDSGKIVAYQAVNLAENLTPEQVAAPGFDLCAAQVASLTQFDQEGQAAGITPDPRTPAERLHCTPK